MKKVIYLLLSAFLAQSFVACENIDFGDINENRNGSKEPYAAGLLSSAIMTYATTTGRDNFLKPTLFVQYQSQVTYTDEMLYNEAPSSWATYYATILPALNKVITYNQDEANHSPELLLQGSPENQIGVAMIMKAIVMKRVTDTWGDAPYSQAFMGLDNIAPEYDSQEDIYKQLVVELREGRDMLDASTEAPLGDILYGGNVNNWKKLANSVLMQVALQMSNKYPAAGGYAAGVFTEALEDENGVIDSIDEEAWFEYDEVEEFQNPFYPNRTADYFLSQEFTDALQGVTGAESLNPTSSTTLDPRINAYAKSATLQGVPYGYRNGSGAGRNQVSTAYYWNATASLPLMTAAYTYLNRAEAAALGWTSEDELEMLEQGMQISFESLEQEKEVDFVDANVATYITARLADAATVEVRQVIAEEKWKVLFGQAFDAWSEWRRTGFPELLPATDFQNSGEIPRRYLYPTEEITLNNANYKTGVSGLSEQTDNNTNRVWWDAN